MEFRQVARGLTYVKGLEHRTAVALAERLRANPWPGVEDVVSGWDVVGIYGEPLDGWQEWIASALEGDFLVRAPRVLSVPVCYALGEDLAEVAGALRMSDEEMISLHVDTEVECLFIGFQPGFGYLGPVHPQLAGIPRRSSPRARVAQGSVGLAAGRTAVYPSASPGGWNLLGRTKAVMVDREAGYFALRAGDRVRFQRVSLDEYERALSEPLVRCLLSADVGEGVSWESEIMPWISAANVGLGEHAGSEDQTGETIRLAMQQGCVLGMHPGYPDRASFGRRVPSSGERERWLASVINQMVKWADRASWSYIKPHGALFHEVGEGQPEVWPALGTVLSSLGLPLVGLPHSRCPEFAAQCGIEFWPEGYAERGMTPDHQLIPRGQPGAELTELSAIRSQALQLADLGVRLVCIHGDRPDAPDFAREVHQFLMQNGVWVAPRHA